MRRARPRADTWTVALCAIAIAGCSTDDEGTADPAAEAPRRATVAETKEAVEAYTNERLAGVQRCLTDAAGERPDDPDPGTVEPEAFVAILSAQLQQLRELEFRQPPDARFLSSDEIERRIGELIAEESEPALDDVEDRMLKALGAIPADDELTALREEALKGQVAGLYDPTSGELLVRADGDFGLVETITLVHELEHALADQRLGIGVGDEKPRFATLDRLRAETAIPEGDATLTMAAYLARYAGLGDLADFAGELEPPGTADESFDRLPYHLQRELLFPYIEGLPFVCDLFKRGGWKAVDGAYEEGPASTGEVLSGSAEGTSPEPPGDPGEGWKSLARGELGAAQLEWLLAAPGGDVNRGLEDPRAVAEDLAGSGLEVWANGEATALGVVLEDRADGLCAAVGEWYGAAFPDASRDEARPGLLAFADEEQSATVSCDGSRVSLGIAPDAETASLLAG